MAHIALVGRENGAEVSELSHVKRFRQPTSVFSKTMYAYHCACDVHDLDTAFQLLTICEGLMKAQTGQSAYQRRIELSHVVSGYERWWFLRHRQPLSLLK